MKALKQYKKTEVERLDLVVKTIAIERAQSEFIARHNLNLSKLTRDLLAAFIKNNEVKHDKK